MSESDKSKKEAGKRLTEQVARENAVHTSNGNRETLSEGETNDAQLGGPDLKKAQSRQPPDATRTGI